MCKESRSLDKKSIVVSGANGFMGSRLVAEALMDGSKVFALARSGAGETAEARVLRELANNLADADLERVRGNLTTFDYDIMAKDLSLSEDAITLLNSEVSAVYNFVGNTNFFPKDVDMLFATNINGAENMIRTLCRSGAVFNHVSTAYVAGAREGRIPEDIPAHAPSFKNHYEESKFQGEQKVVSVCTECGVPYNIFRPSIVIRNKPIDGKSPNLNHFYSFIGLVDILRKHAERKMHKSDNESISIPVRFLGKNDSTLNFVDLDYSVKAMYAIATRAQTHNQVYHLVNPDPATNKEFVAMIMEVFKITGFSIVEDESEIVEITRHEKMFKRGLANYISYFFVDARFDDSRTRAALEGTGISCPKFDVSYLALAAEHHA